MNSETVNEIIEELSSSLQRIETQSAALMEFVKEKGLAKDDELAPYLERASAASSVRWRATRVRLAHLFAGIERSDQRAKERREPGKQEVSREEAQHQNIGTQKQKEEDLTARSRRTEESISEARPQPPDNSRIAGPSAKEADHEAQEANKEAADPAKPREVEQNRDEPRPSRGRQGKQDVATSKKKRTEPSDGNGSSAA